MNRSIRCMGWGMIFLWTAAVSAATLEVGPGKTYSQPSEAFRAAQAGDEIRIDAAGRYDGDVATIRTDRLTIRGVGDGRAKIPAAGQNAGGKAIWVITGNDVKVANIEFSGARVPDRNGAGIRPEGNNLHLTNCRFYDCENGILGGVGQMLIECCEFDHCGPVADPATHSCYIGRNCTRLVFIANYSTHTYEGHLLKSRAAQNFILYNRLTDEQGTGSAVIDLPNGGLAVVLGNVLHKGPKAQNDRMIAYGMEGLKYEQNALYVINNTMFYQYRRPSPGFVRVEHVPDDFTLVIRNNLCIGDSPLTNSLRADAAGNLLFRTPEEAGLVDAASMDFHLKSGSPCIDQGIAAGEWGKTDLTPRRQYVHSARGEERPTVGRLDVGAYEWSKRK